MRGTASDGGGGGGGDSDGDGEGDGGGGGDGRETRPRTTPTTVVHTRQWSGNRAAGVCRLLQESVRCDGWRQWQAGNPPVSYLDEDSTLESLAGKNRLECIKAGCGGLDYIREDVIRVYKDDTARIAQYLQSVVSQRSLSVRSAQCRRRTSAPVEKTRKPWNWTWRWRLTS